MTEQHSIAAALADFIAAPQSRKAAMLVVLLIDRAIDDRFAHSGSDDRLAFRAALAASSPALALVMAVAAMRADGARLVLEAVALEAADAAALSEPDYMVSLYNAGTVQRVLIADGAARHDALVTLSEAVRQLAAER